MVLAAAALVASAACQRAPLVTTPVPGPPPGCPLQGCNAPPSWPRPLNGPLSACSSPEGAACGGASPRQCTERALAAWGDAEDARALSCVARMLTEACALGEARACAFAGRLWLDGHGVARDVDKGLAMLTRACDGGFLLGCSVATAWLAKAADKPDAPSDDETTSLRGRLELEESCLAGQSDACFQVGQSYEAGRAGFPHDLSRAAQSYGRGCDLEDARACNGIGCALEYGDGVGRDPHEATAYFERSCHLGEVIGCANVGYMAEHGEGTPRDLTRARSLYRGACVGGELYGCLHVDMLDAQRTGVPRDSEGALAYWEHGCDHDRSARACAFVSILYLDGHDGGARDEAKSLRAMSRACDFGDRRACEWVKAYSEE